MNRVVWSLVLSVLLIGGLIAVFLLNDSDGIDGDPGAGMRDGLPEVEDTYVEELPTPENVTANADDAAVEPAEETVEPVVPDGPVSIAGRIIDREGEGVPGARVTAVAPAVWVEDLRDLDDRFRDPFTGITALRREFGEKVAKLTFAETDSEGRYALHSLPPNEYELFVTHEQYLPERSVGVFVDEEGAAERDIELRDGKLIAGRVVDPDGKPVAGAVLSCETADAASVRGMGKMMQVLMDVAEAKGLLRSEVRSGEDGTFRIGGLTPELFDLKVFKEGFARTRIGNVMAGLEDITVELDRGVEVTGVVLTAAGEPAGGAKVVIAPPLPDLSRMNPVMMAGMDIDFLGEKRTETTVNSDGAFVARGVASGFYQITVSLEGHPEKKESLHAETGAIDLGEIRLPTPLSISGVVLGADGFGVDGASVFAKDSRKTRGFGRDDGRIEVTADEKGRFEISGLDEGSYAVGAEADDLVPPEEQTLEAGATGVTIRMARGVDLRGVVRDRETRDPIVGAKVQVWSGVSRRARTDENGEFVIAGLKDDKTGQVHVNVSHGDYERTWTNAEVNSDTPTEILMKAQAPIRGVVVDVDGNPVSRAKVVADFPGIPRIIYLIEADQELSTFTDANGEFSLTVTSTGGPPIPPELIAVHPKLGSGRASLPAKMVERFSRRRGRPTAGAEDPGADEGDETVQIVLSPSAAVHGQISDDGGGAIALAAVRFHPVTSTQIDDPEMQMILQLMPKSSGKTAYTAPDGTYRLTGVVSGTYRIEVDALGFAKKTIETFDVSGDEVRVDVSLESGGTVEGEVVDHEGNPLAGVQIAAVPAMEVDAEEDERTRAMLAASYEVAAASGTGLSSTQSDEEGRYTLDRLPQDTDLVVSARLEGFSPAYQTGVRAGSSVDDLELRAFSGISGTVVDAATGSAIPKFRVQLQSKEPNRRNTPWRDGWHSSEFQNVAGEFEFDSVRDGEYVVSAIVEGYAVAARTVRLHPGANEQVHLAVDRGAAVSGIVTAVDTGQPVENVNVYLSFADREVARAANHQNFNGRTDAEGRFSIDGLGDAEYHVQLNHKTYFFEDERPRISVVDGAVPELSLQMRLGGRLKGSFVAPEEFDFDNGGFAIELVSTPAAEDGTDPAGTDPKPGDVTVRGWVGRGGQYRVDGIRPGTYRLRIREQRWREPAVASAPRDFGEVEIEPGRETKLDVDFNE